MISRYLNIVQFFHFFPFFNFLHFSWIPKIRNGNGLNPKFSTLCYFINFLVVWTIGCISILQVDLYSGIMNEHHSCNLLFVDLSIHRALGDTPGHHVVRRGLFQIFRILETFKINCNSVTTCLLGESIFILLRGYYRLIYLYRGRSFRLCQIIHE